MMEEKKNYLFLFGQNKSTSDLTEFAVSEIEAAAKSLNISQQPTDPIFKPIEEVLDSESGYSIFTFENDDSLHSLMSRLFLTKFSIEIWGFGRNYKELNHSLLSISDQKRRYFHADVSFSFRVKGIRKKVQMKTQSQRIGLLSEEALPFQGKVDLSNPDAEFYIVEEYVVVDNVVTDQLKFIYFGRFICEGQRRLLDQFALTKRKFIGNTSMDPEMSFVMSNMACVKSGSLVLDPFVGSGSLLVGAAYFKAYVVGADINYNVVYSTGKSSRHSIKYRENDESIRNNLKQYGLEKQYIDVLLSDAAQHCWKQKAALFDAIITDPPYGIREKSSKIGCKNEILPEVALNMIHHPEKKKYHLDQVFKDLLQFSATMLVPNGRLVYFLPVSRIDYSSALVPTHPALRIVGNYEQVLNRHSSRRLIVMEKIADSKMSFNLKAEIKSDFYTGPNAFRKSYFN